MTGRPSTYTDEMGDLICERLVQGDSLNKMCKEEGMPSSSAVYVWIERHPTFAEKYARARSAQTEAMLEQMLDIADDAQIDPQDKRIRIDTRKWAMSKLRPKKYGDKLDLEHSGPDGGAIKVESTVGLAVAAIKELKALRMARGERVALPAPEATPEDAGEDLI